MRLAGVVLLLLLSLVAGGALAGQRPAPVLSGTVSYVSDGDTLWIRTDDEQQPPLKLRLAGIDAPERCQAHGEAARRALQARLLDRRVSVQTRARDTHGRLVAKVSDRGADVAAWLVAEGHAWSPGYRGRPGPYAELERAARAARKGLFADPAALPPREFRQRHGACQH